MYCFACLSLRRHAHSVLEQETLCSIKFVFELSMDEMLDLRAMLDDGMEVAFV